MLLDIYTLNEVYQLRLEIKKRVRSIFLASCLNVTLGPLVQIHPMHTFSVEGPRPHRQGFPEINPHFRWCPVYPAYPISIDRQGEACDKHPS
jgi:hypothetical protein